MCIIIYRPKGAASRLSKKTLRHCAMENPDGFGLMWSYKGQLHIAKYLWADLGVFIKRIQVLQDTDTPFLAHFRFTTHGKSNLENAHPYWIHPKESALMHNGILNIKCERDWSDTRTFVNLVLRPLPMDWDQRPHLRWLVDEAALGSKLAIMYKDGSVTLVHASAGTWDDGIWYSNTGYKEDKYGGWDDYVWKENGKNGFSNGANGFNFKPKDVPAITPGPMTDEDKERLKVAEGKALAARLAWEESRRPTESTEATGLGLTATQQTSLKLLPSSYPASPKTTSTLYMFEGLTICEDCKRMETSAANVPVLSGVEAGDSCDICHQPGTPTPTEVRDMSVAEREGRA